jgi:hypothetical protein
MPGPKANAAVAAEEISSCVTRRPAGIFAAAAENPQTWHLIATGVGKAARFTAIVPAGNGRRLTTAMSAGTRSVAGTGAGIMTGRGHGGPIANTIEASIGSRDRIIADRHTISAGIGVVMPGSR